MNSALDRPTIPEYELIRRIGRGGYGDVWLARGLTGILRAIKVVWRERFSDGEPFEREFNGLKEFTAVSLAGPSQLALLHAGRNEAEGFFYYVMELADDAETGRTVTPDRYVPLTLKEVRVRRGRLPADEAIGFAIELAKGLACLHQHGLVHRDIKPSNVVIIHGKPKLADIGLVASRTSAASYVGTDGYVAPEGGGLPPADVYAFGKLLYEVCTGQDRRQFPRLPEGIEDFPDRKELLELNEIILRACDPELHRRYGDADAMLDDLLELQSGGSLRRQRTRRAARRFAVGLLAAVGIAGAIAWFTRPAAHAPASIAVLPFANLSEERPGGAVFSDGVHEDILSRLTQLQGFRVVSRTTVLQYRDTKKTVRQIADELGVNYVLEGSIQRENNEVHVTGQLIDAHSDRVVWSKSFDRNLTDLFEIQADIAGEIAGALDLTLKPAEETSLRRAPTTSIPAYDLYVQARAIRNSNPQKVEDREPLLLKAVALDPNFAEAWGDLADVEAFTYFSGQDHSPARLTKAKEAIQKAVNLSPENYDVVMALGTYYYYGYRDYAAAQRQYERLLRWHPNDPEIYSCLGLIQRRQGQIAPAVANMKKALDLDPRNLDFLRNLQETLEAGRHWSEAIDIQRRMVALLPASDVANSYHLAELPFLATGSTAEGDEYFKQLPKYLADSTAIAPLRLDWALDRGDLAEAIRIAESSPNLVAEPGEPKFKTALFIAIAYAGRGDRAKAAEIARPAVAEARKAIQEQPENAEYWAFLGADEALAGDPHAVPDARRAMELVPESLDALDGAAYRLMFAITEMWSGQTDAALAEARTLLSRPHYHGFGPHLAKVCAVWLPLQSDPRFRELVDDPKSNEPLY